MTREKNNTEQNVRQVTRLQERSTYKQRFCTSTRRSLAPRRESPQHTANLRNGSSLNHYSLTTRARPSPSFPDSNNNNNRNALSHAQTLLPPWSFFLFSPACNPARWKREMMLQWWIVEHPLLLVVLRLGLARSLRLERERRRHITSYDDRPAV